MSKLRRLLIDNGRITSSFLPGGCLEITNEESHYLRRVIRLRKGDEFSVVDGIGNRWNASLESSTSARLLSLPSEPIEKRPESQQKKCIAVVLPKRGFGYSLRMSCEMGIDVIQPLRSKRSNPQTKFRLNRYQTVIKEAVEQSERLWAPIILDTLDFQDWLQSYSKNFPRAIASTRLDNRKQINSWLNDLDLLSSEIWTAIGPEGGWTKDELAKAKENGCIPVDLGDFILRTDTAIVAATQAMTSFR